MLKQEYLTISQKYSTKVGGHYEGVFTSFVTNFNFVLRIIRLDSIM